MYFKKINLKTNLKINIKGSLEIAGEWPCNPNASLYDSKLQNWITWDIQLLPTKWETHYQSNWYTHCLWLMVHSKKCDHAFRLLLTFWITTSFGNNGSNFDWYRWRLRNRIVIQKNNWTNVRSLMFYQVQSLSASSSWVLNFFAISFRSYTDFISILESCSPFSSKTYTLQSQVQHAFTFS